MARCVDADKTLDMMWNALYQYEDDMEKKHGLSLTERLDVQNGFEIAHKVVVDAPTADVAPVIHAHWTYEIDDLFPADSMMICSNCGEYERLGANDNYCGHCGAKMDEEV